MRKGEREKGMSVVGLVLGELHVGVGINNPNLWNNILYHVLLPKMNEENSIGVGALLTLHHNWFSINQTYVKRGLHVILSKVPFF